MRASEISQFERMWEGWAFSAALHIAVVGLAVVGLPHLSERHEQMWSSAVDVVVVPEMTQEAVTAVALETVREAVEEAESPAEAPPEEQASPELPPPKPLASAEADFASKPIPFASPAEPIPAPRPDAVPAEDLEATRPPIPEPKPAPAPTASEPPASVAEIAEAPPAEASLAEPPPQQAIAPIADEMTGPPTPADFPAEPAPSLEQPPAETEVPKESEAPDALPDPDPAELEEAVEPDSAAPVKPPEVAAAEPERLLEERPASVAESEEATPAEPAESTDEVVPLMANILPQAPRPRPLDVPPIPQARPEPEVAELVKARPETARDRLSSILRDVEELEEPSERRPAERTPEQLARATDSSTSRATQLRVQEIAMRIRGQVERCWRIDAGARNAQDLEVRLRVRLNPDGSVIGQPEFVDVDQVVGDAFYRTAAENARRAILACQPYELPLEGYDLWKDLVLNFNPREMF